MAHYDIFREQLAITFPGYGHALWEPSSGDFYHFVEVGDVGYIIQGRFHRLFNILLPENHPSHKNFGVPDYHKPFKPNVSKHLISGVLCPDNFCSAGVTLESDEYHGPFATRPRDPGEVSFSCSGKQGALLSLPIQAKREDTVVGDGFGKWMIKHIDLWFAWIREKGLNINRMEDIILVTGTDLTRSWANVAFLGGQADARVSFGVEVVQSRINWKFSPERKTGAAWNWRPSEENPPEDQCIFLRGWRVARKRLILRSKLKAAAGPNPDPKEDDSEPDADLISIPSVPKYRDPLHVILEYIAEERPNCDTFIVHDDDLALLDVLGDGTSLDTLQPDVVLSCLRRSKPVIHEVVLGSTSTEDLSSGNNGASDDTEIVRVASLSATFERQSLRTRTSDSEIVATTTHILQSGAELYIDGHIAQMFRPEGAAAYFARLLRVDLRTLRFTPSPEWPSGFLICSPQIPHARTFTIAHGLPAWLLDFAIRPIGTIIQQRIWTPRNETQRLAHAPLNMPIFFILNDHVTPGLPIVSAATGEHMMLRGAGTPAPVGGSYTTCIRINWPGYYEHSSQILIRDQTPAHNTLTVERFAKRVASVVCRFMDEASSRMLYQGDESRWRIGPGTITKYDVTIVGVVHVSQGSWQPILQLTRYVL